MDRFLSKIPILLALLFLVLADLAVSAQSPAVIKLANNKMSSDIIPPEVTLPNGSAATAPSTANANPYGTDPSINNNPAGQMNNPYGGVPSSAISNGGQANNANETQTNPANSPSENQADPIALIETDKGNISIRLFRKYAPKSTANFIDLVNRGFYNGLTFHRVEPGFCIQGGCPRGDGFGVYYEPNTKQPRILPLETSPYLKHNAPGVVAMAHFPKNPNTSSCQFYITLAAEPQLDGEYSIFGGVVQGMDVVNKIAIGDKMKRVTIKE